MTETQLSVFEFRQHKIIYNEDDENIELEKYDIYLRLKKYAKKFVFQLEKGEQNGYLHFQGRMSLIKRKRLSELKKLMEEDQFTWIKPTLTKEHQKTAFYQMKEDTRVDGPWDDTMDFEPVIITKQLTLFKNMEMRPFQKKLYEISQTFCMRSIYLIYDIVGNIGKSLFAEYMESMGIAEEIPPYRLMDDIFQWVCCRPIRKCYIIDLPRGMKKDKLADLYSGIEIIKNGTAYDKRNRAKKVRFDRPQIFVFTNTLPQLSLMTTDRWKIYTIDPKTYDLVDFNPADNIYVEEDTIEIPLNKSK